VALPNARSLFEDSNVCLEVELADVGLLDERRDRPSIFPDGVRVHGLDPAVQERAGLTDRQADCLDLHLRGMSYRRIAGAQCCDESTVRHHVRVAHAAVSDDLTSR
jgi:hypothetical protein